MTKAKQPKADVTTEIKEEGSTHEVEPSFTDLDSDISAKKDTEKSESPKTKYKIIDY